MRACYLVRGVIIEEGITPLRTNETTHIKAMKGGRCSVKGPCNQVTLRCALFENKIVFILFQNLFLVFLVVSTMGLIR